jgi:biotin carboxyl carrier protein
MAGVFYGSASPDTPPFVSPGDHVEHGDVVCLVEAMKLFNEVLAPATGKLVRLLVENEEQVQADQPLMIIEH